MSVTFRPAKRENTPLIVGIAGPTKSGKTYSALRVALGLAEGRGEVVMMNAEGLRGHQYADTFDYIATDLEPPFRPERYTEALRAALALEPKPGCIIIDSGSHMHDGPGGILEYHEDELNRLAGNKTGRDRDAYNYTAWIKPKAAENEFIYEMIGADTPIVLCLRAKEKIKIVPGKKPENLGWQPIVGDRVAFETIFTLMLPPYSKGVPDLTISQMREPFDAMIPKGQQLSEEIGQKLAKWAAGGSTKRGSGERPATGATPGDVPPDQPLASGVVTERETSDTDSPPPLSAVAFKHQCAAAIIAPPQIREVGKRLYPGRTAASLTDEERGLLFAELLAEKDAQQVIA